MGARLNDERLHFMFHGGPAGEPADRPKLVAVRDAALAFALAVQDNARDSADRNAAIRFIRLAAFSAEEAIRLDP